MRNTSFRNDAGFIAAVKDINPPLVTINCGLVTAGHVIGKQDDGDSCRNGRVFSARDRYLFKLDIAVPVSRWDQGDRKLVLDVGLRPLNVYRPPAAVELSPQLGFRLWFLLRAPRWPIIIRRFQTKI